MSFRKGPNRFVTIRKKNETDNPQPTIPMTLSQNTFYFIRSLLQRFPVSKKERIDIQPNEKSGISVPAEPGDCHCVCIKYSCVLLMTANVLYELERKQQKKDQTDVKAKC